MPGAASTRRLKGQAKEFWGNPTVQDQVANAQRVVREQAPVVQEKVVDVAKSAASKAKEHVPAGSRDDDPTINI
nr:hypothetical protein [Angustibacter aerolatus]